MLVTPHMHTWPREGYHEGGSACSLRVPPSHLQLAAILSTDSVGNRRFFPPATPLYKCLAPSFFPLYKVFIEVPGDYYIDTYV
jgi:hypothetical protein